VLAAWLSWWPSVATALATAAIFSAAKASPGGIALAVASTAIAAAALLWLIGGDPADADLTHRA
jgi:hypothetical protein